jgi:hypothetical protein
LQQLWNGNDRTGDQSFWADSPQGDLEDEHDGSEPPEDAEPSLGSFDRMTDQSQSWRQRGEYQTGLDREEEDCDKEEDDPEEQSEAQHSGRVFPSGPEIK